MTNILWDSYRDDDDLACELTPPPQPNLGLVKSYRDVCLDGRPLRLPGEGVESRGDVNGDFLRSGLVQESNRARVGFPDNSPDSRSEYRVDDDLGPPELTPQPRELAAVPSHKDFCCSLAETLPVGLRLLRPYRLGAREEEDLHPRPSRREVARCDEAVAAVVAASRNHENTLSEEGTIPSLHLSRGLRPGVLHQLPDANTKA